MGQPRQVSDVGGLVDVDHGGSNPPPPWQYSRPDDLRNAVPVGVRLDHGDIAHAGRKPALDALQVPLEGGQIDFGPAQRRVLLHECAELAVESAPGESKIARRPFPPGRFSRGRIRPGAAPASRGELGRGGFEEPGPAAVGRRREAAVEASPAIRSGERKRTGPAESGGACPALPLGEVVDGARTGGRGPASSIVSKSADHPVPDRQRVPGALLPIQETSQGFAVGDSPADPRGRELEAVVGEERRWRPGRAAAQVSSAHGAEPHAEGGAGALAVDQRAQPRRADLRPRSQDGGDGGKQKRSSGAPVSRLRASPSPPARARRQRPRSGCRRRRGRGGSGRRLRSFAAHSKGAGRWRASGEASAGRRKPFFM